MTRPGHCLGRARLRRPRSGDNLEFMGVLLARRMFSSVPVTVAPFRPARIPRDQPEKKAHSPIDLLPVSDDVQPYDRPLYVVANSVVAYTVSPLSHRDPSEFAAPMRIGLNTLEGFENLPLYLLWEVAEVVLESLRGDNREAGHQCPR